MLVKLKRISEGIGPSHIEVMPLVCSHPIVDIPLSSTLHPSEVDMSQIDAGVIQTIRSSEVKILQKIEVSIDVPHHFVYPLSIIFFHRQHPDRVIVIIHAQIVCGSSPSAISRVHRNDRRHRQKGMAVVLVVYFGMAK